MVFSFPPPPSVHGKNKGKKPKKVKKTICSLKQNQVVSNFQIPLGTETRSAPHCPRPPRSPSRGPGILRAPSLPSLFVPRGRGRRRPPQPGPGSAGRGMWGRTRTTGDPHREARARLRAPAGTCPAPGPPCRARPRPVHRCRRRPPPPRPPTLRAAPLT